MKGCRAVSFTKQLAAACIEVGAAGLGADDVERLAKGEHTVKTGMCILSRFATQGITFAAGHRRHRRYFTRPEMAKAWDAVHSVAATAQREREERRAAREAKAAAKAAPRPRQPHPFSWPDADKQFLREHYPMKGALFVSEKTGHPVRTVRSMASKLGIKCLVLVRTLIPKETTRGQIHDIPKALRHEGRGTSSADKRGPAYMPGDVDTLPRSPDFRYTRCDPPPQPLRTNTHSVFG